MAVVEPLVCFFRVPESSPASNGPVLEDVRVDEAVRRLRADRSANRFLPLPLSLIRMLYIHDSIGRGRGRCLYAALGFLAIAQFARGVPRCFFSWSKISVSSYCMSNGGMVVVREGCTHFLV